MLTLKLLFSFVIRNSRFFIVFSIVSMYFIVYYVGYYKGYNAGKARVEYITIENFIERKNKDVKKKKEVNQLGDANLIKRYCKWVPDLPYDECVRTVKPVE